MVTKALNHQQWAEEVGSLHFRSGEKSRAGVCREAGESQEEKAQGESVEEEEGCCHKVGREEESPGDLLRTHMEQSKPRRDKTQVTQDCGWGVARSAWRVRNSTSVIVLEAYRPCVLYLGASRVRKTHHL